MLLRTRILAVCMAVCLVFSSTPIVAFGAEVADQAPKATPQVLPEAEEPDPAPDPAPEASPAISPSNEAPDPAPDAAPDPVSDPTQDAANPAPLSAAVPVENNASPASRTSNIRSGVCGTCEWNIDWSGNIVVGPGELGADEALGEARYPWIYYKNSDSMTISMKQGVKATGSLANLFANVPAHKIDLSGLDTSGVTDMSGMFAGCYNLFWVVFSEAFDTSNVTNMASMFAGCTNMGYQDSSKDKDSFKFPLSFNTSNVTDMSSMFEGCRYMSSYRTFDVNKSFITSNVTNMSSMFKDCERLKNLDFLEKFDTSQVTDMSSMFSGCEKIDSLDSFVHLNLNKVVKVDNLFNACPLIVSIPRSIFTGSNAPAGPLPNQGIFGGLHDMCATVYAGVVLEHYNWETDKRTLIQADGSCGTCMWRFDGVDTIVVQAGEFDIDANLKNFPWKHSKLKNKVKHVVFNDGAVAKGSLIELFLGCDQLQSVDFTGLDTTEVVTIESMFSGCSQLVSIEGFDALNLGKVTNLDNLFINCPSLANIPDNLFTGVNKPATTVPSMGLFSVGEPYDGANLLATTYRGEGLAHYKWEDDHRRLWCNVVFEADGVPFASAQVNLDETVAEPAGVPQAPYGFAFAEWFADKECTLAWDFNTAVGGDMTLYAGWKPVEYPVTFFANDGSAKQHVETFTYDVQKALPGLAFARDGYYLSGWSTNPSATTSEYAENEFVTNPLFDEADRVFYAVWRPNAYTVIFNANDHSYRTASQKFVYDVQEPLDANTFDRTGYDFVSWNTQADGTGIAYADGELVTSLATSGDVNLYAQWEPHEYGVVFDAQGGLGTMASLTLTYDALPVSLPLNTFERLGYTFAGWNTSPDGTGDAYIDGARVRNLVPEGQAVLYAQWTPNEFAVSFDANGGIGTMPSQVFTYDAPQALAAQTFEREGYTFAGWALSEAGPIAYTDTQVVTNPLFEAGSRTLYAIWKPNTYSVVFDAQGGTGTMSDLSLVYDDDAVKLPAHAFTRFGYTFAGWNTTPDGMGVLYDDQASVRNLATSGTTTLYAQWTPNHYVVAFNPHGGIGSMDPQEFVFDAPPTSLSRNMFTRTGYTFFCWTINESGTGPLFGDGQPVQNIAPSGTTVLYAQWAPITYTVVFNANDGSGAQTQQAFVYNEAGKQLAPNTFERPGYTFKGWATSASGKVAYHNAEAVLNLCATQGELFPLYAVWEPNQYTIAFDANGADGHMASMAFVYDEPQSLPYNRFERTGYHFTGWNTKSDGSGEALVDGARVSALTTSGEVVLYAQWEVNHYTVSFDSQGGSLVDSQSVAYGMPALRPADPVREGYGFLGWFANPYSLTPYSFEAPISSSIVLQARWIGNPYTLAFDANGGEGSMDDAGFVFGTAQALPKSTFTCDEAHHFAGWNTSADGTGVAYADEQLVADVVASGLATLYAQWEINAYPVEFSTGGGTEIAPREVVHGALALKPEDPTRRGYTFNGWFTDEACTQAFDFEAPVQGALQLWAGWTPNVYELSFNVNIEGAEGPKMVNFTYTFGQPIHLPKNTLAKKGYRFAGWNTRPDGTGRHFGDGAIISNLLPAEEEEPALEADSAASIESETESASLKPMCMASAQPVLRQMSHDAAAATPSYAIKRPITITLYAQWERLSQANLDKASSSLDTQNRLAATGDAPWLAFALAALGISSVLIVVAAALVRRHHKLKH